MKRNQLTVGAEYAVFGDGIRKPIEIDNDGKLSVQLCSVNGYSFPKPGEDIKDKKIQITAGSMRTKTYNTNLVIKNGKSAESYLDKEIANSSISDNTVNYQKKVASLAKKYINKGIGLIPGGGKIASKAISTTYDVVEKTIKIVSGPDLSTYNKIYYGNYAELFELKVCMNDNGYILMPTPSTNKRINAVMNYLKEHGMDKTYEIYYRKDQTEYYNGDFPIDEFMTNLETLSTQGVLNESEMRDYIAKYN